MAVPFLKLVADDLYEKLGGDFQNTTLIFPNKRASLFFNQYLWENAGGKTMWTPEYTSIGELFAALADVAVGDPIALAVKLWDVYRERLKPTQPLDQMWGLMEMMLSDFQDIDNNLVEPRKLFVNIADLKELTDFSFLEEEQKEAIEQFFGRFFEGGTADTPLKTRFKKMWNDLAAIYEEYQQVLLHPADGDPMVYEGMMKRRVVEMLMRDDEEAQKVNERLASHTYVMVGFNVLNKTELELFKYIKKNRDAKFYWDYDKAYMKKGTMASKVLNKYEAGQFIQDNIRLLGDEFEGRDIFNNMKQPKQITLCQSPTENAQTRYVGEWVKKHVKEGEPLRASAVILCNEDLLQPVLYSVGEVPAVNVTMGYPLKNTPVHSLMQALLELQVHGTTRSGAWRYKYVSAVLKHPFIQKWAGEASTRKLRELTKGNVVFPTMGQLANDEVLKQIFVHVSGKRLTAYLSDIISLVGRCYQNTGGSKEDFTVQMHRESLFVAYTVVNRIHTLQEQHEALAVGDEMLSRLIMQLMGQATIPFHGEPAIGLQVMGLLETRNLDFRNVIMLSVGEGQMPKGEKRTSLIPYTLRAAFGMTTIEKEVSLYAYYYYRLLQRAESITLLYNANTEGGGKGEMSRFMLQTLAEADELFAEGQEVELRAFASECETMPAEAFAVRKDERVMERLHARFANGQILSPSAINTYMKCPLKFYFNYVAGLRPDEDVSEDVDKPMFGTLFHDAMQKLYEPYVGKPLTSQVLHHMQEREADALLTQKLYNSFAVKLFHEPETDANGHLINYGKEGMHKLVLNGTQLITLHVIKEFMLHQLRADEKMAKQLEDEGGYLQVMSQEEKYTSQLSLADGSQLLLGGYIDRLDLLHSKEKGDRIRIVDYKTSSVPHSAKTVAELFDPEKCAGNYHIMQTLYYCKVLTDVDSPYNGCAVVPALMYAAKYDDKNFSGIIRLENAASLSKSGKPQKVEIEDYKAEYAEEFDERLVQKVEEIFSPEQPDGEQGTFAQCTDEQHCTYCDFLTFCRRHPKKSF